jgi:hypothetical protein
MDTARTTAIKDPFTSGMFPRASVAPGRHSLAVDLVDELICWLSDLDPSCASRHAIEVRTD